MRELWREANPRTPQQLSLTDDRCGGYELCLRTDVILNDILQQTFATFKNQMLG